MQATMPLFGNDHHPCALEILFTEGRDSGESNSLLLTGSIFSPLSNTFFFPSKGTGALKSHFRTIFQDPLGRLKYEFPVTLSERHIFSSFIAAGDFRPAVWSFHPFRSISCKPRIKSSDAELMPSILKKKCPMTALSRLTCLCLDMYPGTAGHYLFPTH